MSHDPPKEAVIVDKPEGHYLCQSHYSGQPDVIAKALDEILELGSIRKVGPKTLAIHVRSRRASMYDISGVTEVNTEAALLARDTLRQRWQDKHKITGWTLYSESLTVWYSVDDSLEHNSVLLDHTNTMAELVGLASIGKRGIVQREYMDVFEKLKKIKHRLECISELESVPECRGGKK